MKKVDVAICVYGKPFNTAVTLASLLQHSAQHIGRIFLQEENEQPFGETVEYLWRCFPNFDIKQYKSPVRIGLEFVDFNRVKVDENYRASLRYQFAWENSTNEFLFLSHNDCLFSSDVIGHMMEEAGDTYSGIGMIGQCWNCPASFAGVCDGLRHESFQPTYEEAVEIVNKFPGPRTPVWAIDRSSPTPFPECRLNEFACLIRLSTTRGSVLPIGEILPFGAMTGDIGTTWFRELRLVGHRFRDYREGFVHAPFSDTAAGDPANNRLDTYELQERRARDFLKQNYPATFDRIDVLRSLSRTLA
jgi:hypothetical protein